MRRWQKILSVLALLAAAVWVAQRWANRPARPAAGPIVLPDGSWAYIEAATFGTNHLVGPPLSHAAQHLPAPLRNALVRAVGRPAMMRFTHTTSEPRLALWLNRGLAGAFPTNQGYFECVLSDTNGFSAGEKIHFAARYPLTVTEFSVFPRRAPEITVCLFHHDGAGAVIQRGRATFTNPAYRQYPRWQPEPLPATRRTSEVAVTLQSFRVGAEADLARKIARSEGVENVSSTGEFDPMNTVFCALQLLPLTSPDIDWQVAGAETSDATGNKVENNLVDLAPLGAPGWFRFSPALWPDETWKVKFELTGIDNATEGAVVRFCQVPLGALNRTNHIGWTTNNQDFTATLRRIYRRAPPAPGSSRTADSLSTVEFEWTGKTNDLRLRCLATRSDDGTRLNCVARKSRPGSQIYELDLPTNATAADFTLVRQRSVWVEFLVRPQR